MIGAETSAARLRARAAAQRIGALAADAAPRPRWNTRVEPQATTTGGA